MTSIMGVSLPSAGSGDVHCQIEKVSGKLPEFWGWVEYAKYMGKETHRHVVYDKWQFNVSLFCTIVNVAVALYNILLHML